MPFARALIPHLVIDTWVFAALCLWRTVDTGRGLRHVPDLLDQEWDRLPTGMPSLAVIVPARNEALTLEPAVRSLLAQDYPDIRILLVNDRSTDATPALLDRFAADHQGQVEALHISDLPEGWLGKTHAMATGAARVLEAGAPDFLLFADADVVFAPDALRRSLAAAVALGADHFITLPTPVLKRRDEAAFLSFFQVLSLFSVRLWRIPDPKSLRDSLGVGAFSLLRREAYFAMGGFEALRMEILDDLYLGRRIKALGLRQRVAFGRNLVRVHWAPGAMGIVGVLTKNLFALFRFRLSLTVFVALWLLAFSLGPVVALFYAPTCVAAVIIGGCALYLYRVAGRYSGVSAANVVFAPLAGALLTWSMLRSAWATLRQGGVRWRGTFYSLRALRAQAGPLFPRRLRTQPVLSIGTEAQSPRPSAPPTLLPGNSRRAIE